MQFPKSGIESDLFISQREIDRAVGMEFNLVGKYTPLHLPSFADIKYFAKNIFKEKLWMKSLKFSPTTYFVFEKDLTRVFTIL